MTNTEIEYLEPKWLRKMRTTKQVTERVGLVKETVGFTGVVYEAV